MTVDTKKLEQFLGQFVNDLGATVHAGMVVIGDRLGLYKALAAGPLTAPELAKFVVADGISAPVVTDGPYPESKELLAGYRTIDVETVERALEIAARISVAPGVNGVPVRQHVEVREVMSGPPKEFL